MSEIGKLLIWAGVISGVLALMAWVSDYLMPWIEKRWRR